MFFCGCKAWNTSKIRIQAMEVRCYRKILHGRKWETKRERGVGDKDRERLWRGSVGGWKDKEWSMHNPNLFSIS